MNHKFTSAAAGLALGLIVAQSGRAATLWMGPTTNFTQSTHSPSDTLVAGKVVLTRGVNEVLYNSAAGETSAGAASPKDTMWAFGYLSNYTTLTYQSMYSLRNGDLAARILEQPMVVHLTNEDIYLSVKFTAWGQHLNGGFAYTRSTPGVVVTPTVSLASPGVGAIFAAPARVPLTALASVSSGTVTNVAYFAGAIPLGSASVAPFSVTGNLAAPGGYAITAVATAGGVSSTSAPVEIVVVRPVAVSLGGPAAANGQFSFAYNVNPGLAYVIQASPDLTNWASIATNIPASSPAAFSEALMPASNRFYRVGRLAGP